MQEMPMSPRRRQISLVVILKVLFMGQIPC